MTPKEVVIELRRIAAAIDNSTKPKVELVAADLKKVIASIKSDKPTKA
jgi:hypothetical protein